MKNITLAIDEKVLSEAREFAAQKGTTVNALVREHLQELVEQDKRRKAARQGLLDLMERSTGQLGPDYKWNREEIYEERMLPRHQRPDLRSGGKRG